MFKFSGGIHPPIYKSSTKGKPIRRAKIPKRVILATSQHTGRPSEPIVKPGDIVSAGSMVAKAAGFISSNLHSPVSGKVLSIERAPHPVLGKCLAIIIETDYDGRGGPRPAPTTIDIGTLSPETIIQAIADAGIVGLGGAAFPAHVKLSPPKEKKIGTLIINGAECEPYLTCDHRLMLERPADIIKGVEIIAKVLSVNNVIIGIEDNKPDAIKAIKTVIARSEATKQSPSSKEIASPATKLWRARNDVLRIVSLPSKYPQGSEKQLIKTLLNRETPSGGLPFDAGVVVQNVATALAIYEAVALNKPLYERVITVSGDCIKEPGNLLVKIGTPAADIVEECGGFISEPEKIIFGGPMMGIAQTGIDAPVIKGTSGILFLSRGEATSPLRLDEESICIRCGACVRICPIGLEPTNIYYAALKSRVDLIKEYSAIDCIECGACSWGCPAKLELAAMIKYAKTMVKK